MGKIKEMSNSPNFPLKTLVITNATKRHFSTCQISKKMEFKSLSKWSHDTDISINKN